MAVPERVGPAEIAALTARLRALSSGAEVDEGERERFLADKDQLIARIQAEQAGRPVRPVGRNQAQNGADDGADEWHHDQPPVGSCYEPLCDGADDGWGAS
ncbi:hypothetical protein [Pseudonocardia sp. KRD291]|uniref:hypothetical protein n=1 Tax=Pseudonocardia sp. KRD291 TaxID=2792007 RepID=UPI001C4A05B1|nr:hypothetical protein [Pseudonocardia sp. KRD291]MBW0101476.1 hypothetical protein [Pseudonocardia sp. KRD291]